MNKRIKYILIIVFCLLMVFTFINSYLNARDKELDIERKDRERIASKLNYSIRRENNLYTLTSKKLNNKKLNDIFYYNNNVYLLYTDNTNGTLIKYIVAKNKVVVLFEEDSSLKDGVTRIGNSLKIGDKLYSLVSETFKDFPSLNDGEIIFPNLKKTLYMKDDGIYSRNIDDNREDVVILNNLNDKYSIYNIKEDGKYILLEKQSGDRKYISVLDSDYNVVDNYDATDTENSSISYNLLDGGSYLLKTIISEDKTTYKIIDITNNSIIFTSDKGKDSYIFQNTKFISNKDGDILLDDFVTNESRLLISKNDNKARWLPIRFIMANDNYSLLLTLDSNDRKFYIFYI